MATVRHFDGGATDALSTLAASAAYDTLTWAAWVKQDPYVGPGLVRNALAGRMASSTVGWSIFTTQSGGTVGLRLDINGTAVSSIPVVSNLLDWVFLAVTYDNATNAVKWYAGPSSESIVEIASTTNAGGQIPTSGGLGTKFGNIEGLVNIGAGAAAWNGFIDQTGLWQIVLTLDEIKEAAFCGSRVQVGDGLIIADITGADPEPALNLASPTDLGVTGTTVLTADGIGCDRAIGGGGVVPPGTPAIPLPPNFSGGPGGGFQIPTLDYPDGGPQQISPTVENARVLQPPDFGKMGISSKFGRGRAPMLHQRAASMFRSLDHLATYTRRRKR